MAVLTTVPSSAARKRPIIRPKVITSWRRVMFMLRVIPFGRMIWLARRCQSQKSGRDGRPVWGYNEAAGPGAALLDHCRARLSTEESREQLKTARNNERQDLQPVEFTGFAAFRGPSLRRRCFLLT